MGNEQIYLRSWEGEMEVNSRENKKYSSVEY